MNNSISCLYRISHQFNKLNLNKKMLNGTLYHINKLTYNIKMYLLINENYIKFYYNLSSV